VAGKIPLTRAYIARLDYLFKTGAESLTEPEVLSHWARYLCVLVSGLLDVAIPEMCTSYAGERSDARVKDYVSSSLNNATNFKTERVLGTFARFGPGLRASMETQLTDAQRDAMHSVVDLRNNIAHGRDSGISFVIMRDYYVEVKAAINRMTDVLNLE